MTLREALKEINDNQDAVDELKELLDSDITEEVSDYIQSINRGIDKIKKDNKRVWALIGAPVEIVLGELGLPFTMTGTPYLIRAITTVRAFPESADKMSASVYYWIALEYERSIKAVDKCIRDAIDYVWKNSDIKVINAFYPFEWDKKRGRPTNIEFITNMAALIRSAER